MGSDMRNTIVTPTYATWDDVPCNASLLPGDILPDGSTILFGTRMTEANATSYDIDDDTPLAPNTAKDMAQMQRFKVNDNPDTILGTDARNNEWFTEYVKDVKTAPEDSVYDNNKIYVNTFKPIVDQLKKKKTRR